MDLVLLHVPMYLCVWDFTTVIPTDSETIRHLRQVGTLLILPLDLSQVALKNMLNMI
jgi:hypothetical protein